MNKPDWTCNSVLCYLLLEVIVAWAGCIVNKQRPEATSHSSSGPLWSHSTVDYSWIEYDESRENLREPRISQLASERPTAKEVLEILGLVEDDPETFTLFDYEEEFNFPPNASKDQIIQVRIRVELVIEPNTSSKSK